MRFVVPLALALVAAPVLALEDPNASSHVLLQSAETQPKGSWKVSGHLVGISTTGAPLASLELSVGVGTPLMMDEATTGTVAAVKWRWLEQGRVRLATLGLFEAHGHFDPGTVSFENGGAHAALEQLATICLNRDTCSNQVTIGVGVASALDTGPWYAHGALGLSLRILDHVRLSAEAHVLRPILRTDILPIAVSLPWGTHLAGGIGVYGKSWSLDAGALVSILASDHKGLTPMLSFSRLWR